MSRPPSGHSRLLLLLAPGFLAAAGALLAVAGVGILASPWAPLTLVLAHLVTLGVVSPAAMGGLLRRVAPASASNRARLFDDALGAVWGVGVASLAVGLGRGSRAALFVAFTALLGGVLAFAARAIRAARRPEPRRLAGIALPATSLVLAAALGAWMAHGHAGMRFPGPRGLWLQVHLGAGLLGWVGGCLLLVAAPHLEARAVQAARLRRLVAAGVWLPLGVLAADALGAAPLPPGVAHGLVSLLQLPALLVLGAHLPRVLLGRVAGPSPSASPAGSPAALAAALAPLALLLAGVSLVTSDPRWPMLFGWLAVGGCAVLVAQALALAPPPADASSRAARHDPARPRSATPAALALGLHAGVLATGSLAILLGSDALARAAGLATVASALALARALRSAASGQRAAVSLGVPSAGAAL